MCHDKSLPMADIEAFKDNVRKSKCPFCGKKLEWYDGGLGYEAYRCYSCKFTADHFGIHLDEAQSQKGAVDVVSAIMEERCTATPLPYR